MQMLHKWNIAWLLKPHNTRPPSPSMRLLPHEPLACVLTALRIMRKLPEFASSSAKARPCRHDGNNNNNSIRCQTPAQPPAGRGMACSLVMTGLLQSYLLRVCLLQLQVASLELHCVHLHTSSGQGTLSRAHRGPQCSPQLQCAILV